MLNSERLPDPALVERAISKEICMRWRLFVVTMSSCVVPLAFSGVDERAARAALQRANPDARVSIRRPARQPHLRGAAELWNHPQESAANFLQQHARR
jgi:hypothetical protein